jgi:hypothetical protein
VIPVNLREHFVRDLYTRREIDLEPDLARPNAHKRCLQIFIQPMGLG